MSMHFASIDEISHSIRSGEVSPVEVLEEILERIDRIDPVLCSYATVMAQTARAEAQAATEEIRDGHWRGPLHGVPIAVKDLYGTGAAPTTFGSKHLSSLQLPDAEAVTRLRRSGAVIIGKLRMSEAALTDHGIDLPVPVNPWDGGTWVGTSSSGCASATAAGLCFGSLGSDTGGSIRGPATAAGLTGLKTTRGAVPADGTLPLSRSLDTLGPFARSARDCRLLFEAVVGRSSGNGELMNGTGRPLRVGVAPQLLETVSAATRAMIEETARIFGSLDVEIFEVTLPDGAPLATDWVRFVGTRHSPTSPSSTHLIRRTSSVQKCSTCSTRASTPLLQTSRRSVTADVPTGMTLTESSARWTQSSCPLSAHPRRRSRTSPGCGAAMTCGTPRSCV